MLLIWYTTGILRAAMKKYRTLKIEIGHRTIIFTILFIIALKFLVMVQSILIGVFIAFLLATAIYPSVNFLHRFRIPRSLSAATIILLLVVTVTLIFASVMPLVVSQTTALLTRLPALIEQLGDYQINSSLLTNQFSSFSGNILRLAYSTVSITIMLMTILVITFYLIQERAHLDERLRYLFGEKSEKAKKLYLEIETQLGKWVRTIGLLMFLIGLQTYIGLELIGIDYALPLALIAGLLEIIPNLGPTIATIPAAIVGFSMSPLHGFLAIGLSILIQQVENNVLVPNLMKSSVGLHPVIVIVALIIGFELGGALLAVLSLPLVLASKIVLQHMYAEKKS